MVVACQIAGLMWMETFQRYQGALVWQNDHVLLLPLQGFPGLASGSRHDGLASSLREKASGIDFSCHRKVFNNQ
jgi:hypothetical protein